MKLTKTLLSVAAGALTLGAMSAFAAGETPAPASPAASPAAGAAMTAAAPAPAAAKEKCYGVVKAGKNDCASKSHSCAGKATADKDANEFVLVPAGLCDRIGSLKNAG